jgi:hypothetical protein
MTLPRPILRLKPLPPIAVAEVSAPAAEPDPQPGYFYFNWRVGGARPKKRHATAAVALAEADRLRALCPGATVHTYEAKRLA